jgi:hypothetical protein
MVPEGEGARTISRDKFFLSRPKDASCQEFCKYVYRISGPLIWQLLVLRIETPAGPTTHHLRAFEPS